MASIRDLPGAAERILTLFAAQLTGQGIELPERQYRTPGSLVPWDGEQFTVSLMGIDQGRPGAALTQSVVPQTAIFYAGFSLNLIRAIPILNVEAFVDSEIPTADELDGSGVDLIGDAAALVLAGSAIHTAYTLTDPGVDMVVGPLTPVGPEGGLAGSRLLVSVSLT